jgi:hypothetical protein
MKDTTSSTPKPVAQSTEREIKKTLHVSDMGMGIRVPKVKEEMTQPVPQSV